MTNNLWNLQNRYSSTATHTYTTAGTYHATATVSLNGGGCSYDVKETVAID